MKTGNWHDICDLIRPCKADGHFDSFERWTMSMGSFAKPELIAFIYALLPGFLTAWIFYALSAYPKPSSFERVIQALVFTLLAEMATQTIRLIARILPFGTWTEDVHFGWKVTAATAIGFIAVAVVQNNLFSWLPKRLRITSKTAYPSEWFSAFTRSKSYIYLHLSGERRLWGWAEEWPDDPSTGHFVMMNTAWVLDDNTRVPLTLTERFLIPVSDVERVEFEKMEFTENDVETARQGAITLIEYNKRIEELKSKGKDGGGEKDNKPTDYGGVQRPTEHESTGNS